MPLTAVGWLADHDDDDGNDADDGDEDDENDAKYGDGDDAHPHLQHPSAVNLCH